MKLKLFIVEGCFTCASVRKFMDRQGVDYQLCIDDHNSGVFIYPALFYDDRLIAYGNDIINWVIKTYNKTT